MGFLRRESRPGHAPHILEDSIVRGLVDFILPSKDRFTGTLRRIGVQTDDRKALDLLTNLLRLSAGTIAEIHRDPWKVELFFEALKQSLKVKPFVGTSENALLIQVRKALLALMLLKWLQFLASGCYSLSTVTSLQRQNLFTYRDLRAFFVDLLRNPHPIPAPVQLEVALP